LRDGGLACTGVFDAALLAGKACGEPVEPAWLPTLVLYVRVISVKSAAFTDPS
jgi:hypothetical protein